MNSQEITLLSRAKLRILLLCFSLPALCCGPFRQHEKQAASQGQQQQSGGEHRGNSNNTMGQQQSNKVEKGRRRNSALADGFVTGTSGKVEEKYKIDVSKTQQCCVIVKFH